MTYNLMYNEAHNDFELFFDGKPNEAIRTALKALGMRWHGKEKYWYGAKNSDEQTIREAIENASNRSEDTAVTSAETPDDKAEQKRLKDLYISLIATEVWKNDNRMVDFVRKETARVVELQSGALIAIEKPRIETDFCFGYSDSAYDTADYDRAQNMAHHAATSEDYFIKQNLKHFDEIEQEFIDYNVYSARSYSGTSENTRLHCLRFVRDFDYHYQLSDEERKKLHPLTAKDLENVLAAYRLEREAFKKRLNAYLKRYGMSKVHAWSYWRDE